MTENVALKEVPKPADAEAERPKEVTIDLNTQVQAFGSPVTKLTFRRPTGGDLMALGDAYPIYVDIPTGVYRPNAAAMGQIMSTLAQVPLSTIKSMDAQDFSFCALELMSFFLPVARAKQF